MGRTTDYYNKERNILYLFNFLGWVGFIICLIISLVLTNTKETNKEREKIKEQSTNEVIMKARKFDTLWNNYYLVNKKDFKLINKLKLDTLCQ